MLHGFPGNKRIICDHLHADPNTHFCQLLTDVAKAQNGNGLTAKFHSGVFISDPKVALTGFHDTFNHIFGNGKHQSQCVLRDRMRIG
jgi:hypothetical protein